MRLPNIGAEENPATCLLTRARPGAVRRGRGDAADRAVADATQRLDLMKATTRLLLESGTCNESVTLQRGARLLAEELRS